MAAQPPVKEVAAQPPVTSAAAQPPVTDAAAPRSRPTVHPLAWWIWALALAVAVSGITNPLVLGLVVAVVGYVVAARRTDSPWARTFGVFLRLGLVVIAVRVLLFAVFAGTPGTHVVVTLPAVHLPGWLAGLRVGGPVTVEGLLAATYDGLRLAAVLCCIGATNALTSPRRLVKSLPAALYEAGVAVTIALSVAPQAVATLVRLRRARRLRGHSAHGWTAVRGLLVPTLEGALDGSIDLAAAMDARGFGRRAGEAPRRRRLVAAATLVGLGLLTASTYGLVVSSAPPILGWPLLGTGAALLAGCLAISARGGRTRHRPDRWGLAETLLVASGISAAVLLRLLPDNLGNPSTTPPVVPSLPGLAVGAAVAALSAVWVTTTRRTDGAAREVPG